MLVDGGAQPGCAHAKNSKLILYQWKDSEQTTVTPGRDQDDPRLRLEGAQVR